MQPALAWQVYGLHADRVRGLTGATVVRVRSVIPISVQIC